MGGELYAYRCTGLSCKSFSPAGSKIPLNYDHTHIGLSGCSAWGIIVSPVGSTIVSSRVGSTPVDLDVLQLLMVTISSSKAIIAMVFTSISPHG